MSYRKDIQAFRAIAIMLVVAAHFQLPWLNAGFIGVDIFFVISGYVITRLIDAEMSATGRFDYLNFYARRFNRLVPGLMLMLATVLVFNYFLNAPYDQLLQLPKAIMAALWASNLQLAFEKLDYFSSGAESNLFLHTWSLGVEEQFYIVWPLLFVSTYFFSVCKRNVFFVLVCTASLVACLWISFSITAYAYYLMPMRIWQFLLGAMVFLIIEKREFSTVALRLLHVLGLLLLGLAILVVDNNKTYPGFQILLPTAAAALLLIGGEKIAWCSKIYCSSVLQWIGDRSYSLYLWHWPFWCFINSFPIGSSFAKTSCASLLTFVAATISYKCVENPFRRSIALNWPAKRSLVCTFLAVMVCTFVISLLFNGAETDMVNAESSSSGKYVIDIPSLYKRGCDTEILEDDVRRCQSGLLGAAGKVVLFGDSIGVQWSPAIERIYGKEKTIVSYTKSACTLADKPIYYDKIGRIYHECERWREKVIQRIIEESPEIIFMGSGIVNISQSDLVSGFDSTLKELSKTNAKIYLFRPTPVISIHPIQCLKRESWMARFIRIDGLCNSVRQIEIDENNQVYASLLEVKKKHENIHVLDMNDLICKHGICKLKMENTLSFRDQRHLTANFVERLSSKLHERINQ